MKVDVLAIRDRHGCYARPCAGSRTRADHPVLRSIRGPGNPHGLKALGIGLLLCLSNLSGGALHAEPAKALGFDSELANRLGADERGMRSYVLVILKTGPTRVPDGEQRKAMFAGHFANMERLSGEGKLVLAGPFSADPNGWRGLFVLAVDNLEEAKRLTETDPVIVNGEMVAEYHSWYGSAATMMIPEIHPRLTPPQP